MYPKIVESNLTDYKAILEDCGLGRLPVQAVIKNIAKLEEFYDSGCITDLYNYCLTNLTDAELIIQIIKFSDFHRANSTLEILLNFLQKKADGLSDTEYENLVNIKSVSAKAISNYKDYSTVTVLLSCLNNKHENYKVRLACADALGRIGDKYAVKPLIDVLEDEDEKSIYLKESATSALAMLGDIAAIEPLVNILESKQGFLDKFTFLKEKIVEALGKLNVNNKKVMSALKHSLMDSSPMVRINAIEAIMNSGDESAPELIRPCLQDDNDEVKKNALVALYNLCGRDILDEVIDLPIYSKNLKEEAQTIIDEYEEGEDE